MDAGTEAGDEMNKFTSEFLLYAFPTCAQVNCYAFPTCAQMNCLAGFNCVCMEC